MVRSKLVGSKKRKKKSTAGTSEQPEEPVQLHYEVQGTKRVLIATGSAGSSAVMTLKPRVILRSRLVNFTDLSKMFPNLIDVFKTQHLEDFLSIHGRYYPNLVQEFFGNIHVKDEVFVTAVRGKFIHVCPETFYKALDIPMDGVVYGQYSYSLQKAYSAMTEKDYEGVNCSKIGLNANTFPPLKRLIHHIITTIIYPKGGSRDQVTAVHKFIFYCLFHDVPFSLPHLMTNLIKGCTEYSKRGLPYATQLTKVFAEAGIELKDEPFIDLTNLEVYTCNRVQRFMHFKQDEGRVYRKMESKETSEKFTEKDLIQEESQVAAQAQDQTAQVSAQVQEQTPHAPPQATSEFGQSSSSSSSIQDILMAHGEQLAALRIDMNRIGNDVQIMNNHIQTILHHVESQTGIYKEVMKLYQPDPAPDESNT